jgi:hypothetical protein
MTSESAPGGCAGSRSAAPSALAALTEAATRQPMLRPWVKGVPGGGVDRRARDRMPVGRKPGGHGERGANRLVCGVGQHGRQRLRQGGGESAGVDGRIDASDHRDAERGAEQAGGVVDR